MTGKEEKTSLEIDEQIKVASQILERNINFISNCDNKTAILLTTIGVLFTIVLSADVIQLITKIINNCLFEINILKFFNIVLFLFSFVLSAIGLYNLCGVLVARTKSPSNNTERQNSLIFFSGISQNIDEKIYSEKLYSMTKEELLSDIISQIYINSKIADKKYLKYNRGFKSILLGIILFVIALLLGSSIL